MLGRQSKLSLLNSVFLLILISLAWFEVIEFNPFLSYQGHKFWHIVGACLFLGNIAVGPVWIMMAIRQKDVKAIQFSFKMLLFTDVVVTIPSMILIVVNGLFMANTWGGVSKAPWIKHSVYGLLLLWLFVFPILIVQDRLYGLAKAKKHDTPQFKKAMIWWQVLGGLSLVPVVLVFYYMVYKHL